MSTAVDYVRYSCGIAGEEVAERVDALESMCDRHADELKAAFEAGKKEGWEACETCHGIVDGVWISGQALELKATCYEWLRDRVGVTSDIGCEAGAYVWLPCGGSKITEEDKNNTDTAILRALAKVRKP